MATSTTVDNRRETASLIGSDKVEGTAVYGPDNQKIGSVERVMIDKISGKVAYAVMSFGGFLGMGEDYYPVPWASLSTTRPLDWSDRSRDRAVYDYYRTPLWY
jgi:PRC-barrel domain